MLDNKRGTSPPNTFQMTLKVMRSGMITTPSPLNGMQKALLRYRTPAACGISLSAAKTNAMIHAATIANSE